MRRKKDDKRVLTGRPNNNRNKKSIKSRYRSQSLPARQNRNGGKPNRRLVFFMIFALIAFVIGAGMGITLSFDDGDEAPQYENVTVEMTTNLNDTEPVYYDPEVDDVDFNDQQDLADLNLTNNTTTMNY